MQPVNVIFPCWKESAQDIGWSAFLWWKSATHGPGLLKLKVAELIQGLIGVNNEGFNLDLEENTAQSNADFYPQTTVVFCNDKPYL